MAHNIDRKNEKIYDRETDQLAQIGTLCLHRPAGLPANMAHIFLYRLDQTGVITGAFFDQREKFSVNGLHVHQAQIFQNILPRPIERCRPRIVFCEMADAI